MSSPLPMESKKRGRPDGKGGGDDARPRSSSGKREKKKAAALAAREIAEALLNHGASRKPKKAAASDPDRNVDGLAWTVEEKAAAARRKERAKAYAGGGGGVGANPAKAGRAELRVRLGRLEDRIADAAELNVDREEFLLREEAGFLEAEPGTLERTGKVTQKTLAANVAVAAARQAYALDLPELGPYRCDWTRNGRHLLLAGARGHLAVVDAQRQQLLTEFHVHEAVRGACFLHNESLFAVSQRKAVYIYDRDGVELHCLRNHVEPTALAFLPYHFLLAAASRTG